MLRDFVHDYLLSRGYMYLLLDNVESKDDGSTVLHYELLNENLIENYYDDMITLDSKLGAEIIQQSLMGDSVIWIGGECRYFVNASGIIFRDQHFKKLKF